MHVCMSTLSGCCLQHSRVMDKMLMGAMQLTAPTPHSAVGRVHAVLTCPQQETTEDRCVATPVMETLQTD